MFKKLTKGSSWLSLLEQMVYICPTLGMVLYYYYSSIQQSVSNSSKYSFTISIVLFVFFVIYKKIAKVKIDELRASVVQTETDLKNKPDSYVEERAKLAVNAKKDRRTLDMYDKAGIMITLLIVALGISILERALIGLTMLAYIALGSVLGGFGIHLGVLELRQRESLKVQKLKKKRGTKHD